MPAHHDCPHRQLRPAGRAAATQRHRGWLDWQAPPTSTGLQSWCVMSLSSSGCSVTLCQTHQAGLILQLLQLPAGCVRLTNANGQGAQVDQPEEQIAPLQRQEPEDQVSCTEHPHPCQFEAAAPSGQQVLPLNALSMRLSNMFGAGRRPTPKARPGIQRRQQRQLLAGGCHQQRPEELSGAGATHRRLAS